MEHDFSVRSKWRISGKNGIPEKVVPFSRWKLPNGNLCFIYRFLVFITSSMPFAVFQAAKWSFYHCKQERWEDTDVGLLTTPYADNKHLCEATENGTCDKWNALFPNKNSQWKFSEFFCKWKTPSEWGEAETTVKGIREPQEVKKKLLWPRWESNPRPPG